MKLFNPSKCYTKSNMKLLNTTINMGEFDMWMFADFT